MKIGIFGPKETYEALRLEKAGQAKGHDTIRFSADDLMFKQENDYFKIISDIDYANLDIILLRGLSKEYIIDGNYYNKSTEALVFLKYFHEILKKPVVDQRRVYMSGLGKLEAAMELAGYDLNQPKTWVFRTKENFRKNQNLLQYPIIVKSQRGKQGRNIYKLDTESELRNFLDKVDSETIPWMFQEYLPCDGDIRIFCVGYKALGAMKRFIPTGDFRANISQGGRGEQIDVPTEILEMAQKAAEILKIEIAGVDIIEFKGKYYLLEVNEAPQFKGFFESTGIDPAPVIIEYLEKKYQEWQK